MVELLFFPERLATFEDLDPGHRRGSCKLVVEASQDVKLCTCNLLSWCVVALAPGEESCDCR